MRTLLVFLLVSSLLLPTIERRLGRVRGSFGKYKPDLFPSQNLTEEEMVEKKVRHEYSKQMIALGLGVVMMVSIAVILWATQQKPSQGTFEGHRMEMSARAQADMQFMLQHGIHPNRAGMRRKEMYRKFK